MSMSNRHLSTHRTVYYHRYRWVFLSLGALSLVLALRALGTGSWFMSVILVFLGTSQFCLGYLLRIVTSPAGIAYHNSGLYTVATPWSNIECVTTILLRVFGPMPVLLLREPVVQGWTSLAWMLPAQQRGRVIPLTDDWAERDRLIHDIREYAPHVPISL